MADDEPELLPDETFYALFLFSLLAALPTLGWSLIGLWIWQVLPRARAPKEIDGFLELRRTIELALPLLIVLSAYAVFAWQWAEGHPTPGALKTEPWPVAPTVFAILFVLGGITGGLSVTLRAFLARSH